MDVLGSNMANICTACLSYGRQLHFLGETGFYHMYAHILKEIQVHDLSQMIIRVCWECRALLRRFDKFKGQVKRSYVRLMQHANLTDPVKSSGLQFCRLGTISYLPGEVKSEGADCCSTVELDMKTEPEHQEPEAFVNNFSTELEIKTEPEHQEPEAFVNDLSLVMPQGITLTKHEKKTKEKKSKFKNKPKLTKKRKRKRSSEPSVGINSMDGHSDESCREIEMADAPAAESERDGDTGFNEWGDSPQNDYVETSDVKGDKKTKEKKMKLKIKLKVGRSHKRKPAGDIADVAVLGNLEYVAKETEDRVVAKRREGGDIVKNGSSLVDDLKVNVKENGHPNKVEKCLDPERPQCSECGKTFSSKKTYRYHMNVLHKGQNRYPCPRCGKVYQWKSNLGRHMRTHKARDAGELHCALCDKRFASVATYRQHLRISRRHISETEFSFMCNECGKRFVSKTRLRDHIDWEHLHNIKFRCQLCNKPFKCHTSLYVHLQNVHRSKDKKDNLCHVCGKSYQNGAKLKYHIVAMHTSETPYRCAHCAAAFGWYSSLYRHVREVHYKMKVQPKKTKKLKKFAGDDLPQMIPHQQILSSLHQTAQL